MYHRYEGGWICRDDPYFDGTALELGAGVKLKWRPRRSAVQFHVKLGGAVRR